jgi:hypothetical protein
VRCQGPHQGPHRSSTGPGRTAAPVTHRPGQGPAGVARYRLNVPQRCRAIRPTSPVGRSISSSVTPVRRRSAPASCFIRRPAGRARWRRRRCRRWWTGPRCRRCARCGVHRRGGGEQLGRDLLLGAAAHACRDRVRFRRVQQAQRFSIDVDITSIQSEPPSSPVLCLPCRSEYAIRTRRRRFLPRAR